MTMLFHTNGWGQGSPATQRANFPLPRGHSNRFFMVPYYLTFTLPTVVFFASWSQQLLGDLECSPQTVCVFSPLQNRTSKSWLARPLWLPGHPFVSQSAMPAHSQYLLYVVSVTCTFYNTGREY
jgi:hypothetical protein